jgi:hypothetical protein
LTAIDRSEAVDLTTASEDDLLTMAVHEELLAREHGRRRTLCRLARFIPTWCDTVACG